ncbi:MAG: FprA family A-type flavoprotein [Candidatus Eisenbacteria bacterium]|nr:FprA family A-type flavoprotein [Candidatus Eisenbacteria bacterium]
MGPYQAIQVSEHVYWVGAIDWRVRDFHGYSTERGSTYNAYLITGSEPILVDTVKRPFVGEMLARIGSVIDPQKIRVLLSNHSEMDHSGSLPAVIERSQPERLLASPMGVKTLAEHFELPLSPEAVPVGERLTIGDRTLFFAEARMLHWPESMFSYLVDDRLFFSQDAFGMHLSSFERFCDELSEQVIWHEAAKYYANILLPYSPMVAKAVAALPKTEIGEAELIAPDHGPIWRRDVWRIAERYAEWAVQRPTRKAVIVYDTMWESTAKMAYAIAEGLQQGGARPRLVHLTTSNRSVLATEILDAGALIVGSPTINNQLFPTLADGLSYLKGLRPKNLIGAAFGSYGWSGESPRLIESALREMKVDLVSEAQRVKYVPRARDLEACAALGVRIAEKLGEITEEEA